MTAFRRSGVEEPALVAVTEPSFGERANDKARRKFAPRYLLNTLRNIPTIAASADVSALFNAATGVPAVVVAAGPSLDRNLEALRALAPHVLLIAVDTAARPLLEAGVEPQLVVAVDPSVLNARHLRDLPDTGRTWLVAEGSLDPSAFEWFAGRTFVFSVSDHEPWPWLRAAGLGRGRLRAWGSVLTSACDLALRAGCDPIVFAGADLAYTGGQPYCRGTVYEHDWALRTAQGEPLATVWAQMTAAKARLRSDDVHGRPVATSQALLAFRDWIVKESVAHPGRRFINATEDGVLRGGLIEQRTLTDALPEADRPRVPALSLVADAWHTWRVSHAPDIHGLRQTLAAFRETGAGAASLAAWLRFAGGDVPAEAVDAALAHARSGCASSGAAPAPGPVLLARGAPERVYAIRVAIASGVTGPPPDGHEAGPASRQLAALIQSPGRLLVRGSTGPCIVSAWAPAARAFSWRPEAVAAVYAFEQALADVATGRPVGTAHQLPEVPPAPPTSPPGTPQPVLDGVEMAARLRLAADWLSVVGTADPARAEYTPATVRSGPPVCVAAALLRAGAHAVASAGERIAEPRASGHAPGVAHVTIGTIGEITRSLPYVADTAQWADALTGALAPAPDGDDTWWRAPGALPRVSFTVPDAGSKGGLTVAVAIEPAGGGFACASTPDRTRWLLPARVGLPAPGCMIGSTLDDSHALFTLVNGTHSVRVDACGGWVPEPLWPGAIVGEVRLGETGAVAWHNADTSRVLWREHPEGPVRQDAMPFTACLAFPQPDGTIWWTSFQGGLWSWAPGRAWQRLVDTPPVMGLVTATDAVYLQPSGDDSAFAVRPGVTDAFRWVPGTSTVEPVPLGPDGPCWSAACRNGWTALAYPHGHVIHLTHADGLRYALVCGRPFNLAWAGASLVVSTTRAELLVFHDLLSLLEETRAESGDAHSH